MFTPLRVQNNGAPWRDGVQDKVTAVPSNSVTLENDLVSDISV